MALVLLEGRSLHNPAGTRTQMALGRCSLPCPLQCSLGVCVFITAGPITKLFAWGGGGHWRTCATRLRAEACVCVFFLADSKKDRPRIAHASSAGGLAK